MTNLSNRFFAVILVLGISIIPAFAQIRGVNERQVRTLISRIETKKNTFKNQLNRS